MVDRQKTESIKPVGSPKSPQLGTPVPEHIGEQPASAAMEEKLRQTGEDLRKDIPELAHAAAGVLNEKLEEAQAIAGEYYEAGRDRALQYEQDFKVEIRASPIRSLLIAAGVGLCVGLVFRR